MGKVLQISGPDSADFLHRLTTQDVKGLKVGERLPAALLRGDATIVSLFDLENTGDEFLVIVEQDWFEATKEHLEKMHFAENLEIKIVDGEKRETSRRLFVFGVDITTKNTIVEAPLEDHVSREK